jgi:hypothetical protein
MPGRCDACGRIVSLAFPMHECLRDGDVRYSVSRYATATAAEHAPTEPATLRGAFRDTAATFLGEEEDPSEWCVTRWTADGNDFGFGVEPDKSVSGDLFLADDAAR